MRLRHFILALIWTAVAVLWLLVFTTLASADECEEDYYECPPSSTTTTSTSEVTTSLGTTTTTIPTTTSVIETTTTTSTTEPPASSTTVAPTTSEPPRVPVCVQVLQDGSKHWVYEWDGPIDEDLNCLLAHTGPVHWKAVAAVGAGGLVLGCVLLIAAAIRRRRSNE